MKKLIVVILICLFGFGIGAYKLSNGHSSYVSRVESFEVDTLDALEKIRLEGDVVDYEKTKNLMAISSDRSLSKFYVGVHHKLEVFLLALLFGVVIFYEVKSSKILNKNSHRKTQA